MSRWPVFKFESICKAARIFGIEAEYVLCNVSAEFVGNKAHSVGFDENNQRALWKFRNQLKFKKALLRIDLLGTKHLFDSEHHP